MSKRKDEPTSPRELVQAIIDEKIADITTVLSVPPGEKSRLYEEIMEMVERSLLKIALERNNSIKSKAAIYLGINRNTLQKKMNKYGL